MILLRGLLQSKEFTSTNSKMTTDTEQKPLTKHIVARTIKLGQVFGNWTILRYDSIIKGKTKWLCRCRCGNESVVFQQSLIKGKSEGCGCHRDYHGETRETPEYSSWQCMKSRCLNPNNTEYHRYGGRGIKVCDRWMRYVNFLADMGRAPIGKNTIERNDFDGNYEPSNCRWASIQEQLINRRNTVFVEYKGEKKALKTWCDLFGLEYGKIYNRQKYGRKIPFQEQFNNHLCQIR